MYTIVVKDSGRTIMYKAKEVIVKEGWIEVELNSGCVIVYTPEFVNDLECIMEESHE